MGVHRGLKLSPSSVFLPRTEFNRPPSYTPQFYIVYHFCKLYGKLDAYEKPIIVECSAEPSHLSPSLKLSSTASPIHSDIAEKSASFPFKRMASFSIGRRGHATPPGGPSGHPPPHVALSAASSFPATRGTGCDTPKPTDEAPTPRHGSGISYSQEPGRTESRGHPVHGSVKLSGISSGRSVTARDEVHFRDHHGHGQKDVDVDAADREDVVPMRSSFLSTGRAHHPSRRLSIVLPHDASLDVAESPSPSELSYQATTGHHASSRQHGGHHKHHKKHHGRHAAHHKTDREPPISEVSGEASPSETPRSHQSAD